MRIRKHFQNQGFTLIEAVVVIAIIAIIAVVGAPLVQNFAPDLRLKGSASALHTNLEKAKVEAIKRNRNVLIRLNPVACTPFVAGGSVEIAVDNDNDGTLDPHPTDSWFPMKDDSGDTSPDLDFDMPRNSALCNTGALSGGTTIFKYSPRGFWLDSLNSPLPGNTQFNLQNENGTLYRVTVSIAGGVKTARP